MPNPPLKNQVRFKDLFIKNFRIIIVLVIVIILGAAYFLLLGPKYQQLKQGGQFNLTSQRQTLKALEKHLADLKVLQQNLREVEEYDLSRLKFILPAEQDLPGLFVQLEKLTAAEGFTLLNINITAEPSSNKTSTVSGYEIKKLNITLTVAGGNYPDLLRLLGAFEYNLRLMDITSINFIPSQLSSSYSLNLVTYYLTQ